MSPNETDANSQFNHGLLSGTQSEVGPATQQFEMITQSGKRTLQNLNLSLHQQNTTIYDVQINDLKYSYHDNDNQETAGVVQSLVQGSWRYDPFDSFGHVNSPQGSFLLSHCKSLSTTNLTSFCQKLY
jgi:hypothetical protein